MKRLLLAVAFCLAGFSCLAATLPLGPGSIFPIGPSATGTPPSNPQFFVDAVNGNDSNNGTMPALAWKTITHVNAQTFAANSTLSFHGSQTFSGGIVFTAANASSPTVQVYGAGQAVISSGNSAECVKSTDVAGLTIKNIVCTGGGNTTNTTAGISVINDQAGNTKLAGPTISGVTVSGYGYNGISVQGSNGSSGFNGITIAGNTVHDVTGNSTDSFGTSCIMVFSKTNYGSGATTPAHTNVSITGNTVSNCTGTTTATFNWTGSGIFVSEASNVVIGGCSTCANVAHDFGGSNGDAFESGGIWAADGANILISYNEAFNGLTGPGNAHADGGGLDGGVINSVYEKNWIHDNAGLGVILENYFDGTCCTLWANNTYRDNILQNNCGAGDSTNCAEIFYHFPGAATGPAYVYNNTIVNQIGGNAFGDNAGSSAAINGNNWNNIIAVNNLGKLLNFTNVASLTFAGNDYYTYGTAAKISWNGTTYSNASVATAFAAWQTATGQEKIAGVNVGLTSNPQIYVPGGGFINNGYAPANLMAYNLQTGSPMIGAGLNLQTQFGINPGPTDYYGVAISAASLPVGAANGDFTTFVASCAQSSNFLTRVSSYAKLDNVNENSLDCGWNSDGIWSKIDLLYMLAAPNSAASLLNHVSSSFSLVAHNAPTFTALQGYASNGTNAYLDTQWVPSTNGVNYTLTSATHLGYSLTDGSADSKAIYGAQNAAANSETSSFPGTPGWYADANDFTGTTASTTTSKGSFLLNRLPTGTCGGGVNCLTQVFNGAFVHANGAAPVAMPNQNMILLCFNAGTGGGIVANQCGTEQIAAVLFGGGSIDAGGTSRRINSFMQAYGINTY